MSSWLELWQQRNYISGQLERADRDLALYVDDEERHEIEDLTSTHGKRFLFDELGRTPNVSTSDAEAPSRSSLVPSLANQERWARARLRACTPGCACACARCAWMRARARHARWGADPT